MSSNQCLRSQPSSSGPPLEQIAASAKLVGGGPGGAGGPRVQLASLGAYDLRVDRERHKSKCVYAGKYKGLGVKVTFSSVGWPGVRVGWLCEILIMNDGVARLGL